MYMSNVDSSQCGDKPASPQGLTSLPIELLLLVVAHTTPECSLALFPTCRLLSTLLRPIIFHTLHISSVARLTSYLKLLTYRPSISLIQHTRELILSWHGSDTYWQTPEERDIERALHISIINQFGLEDLRELRLRSIREVGGSKSEKYLRKEKERSVTSEERVFLLWQLFSYGEGTKLEKVEVRELPLEPMWLMRFMLEAVSARKLLEGKKTGDGSESENDPSNLIYPIIQRGYGLINSLHSHRLSTLTTFTLLNAAGIELRPMTVYPLLLLPNLVSLTLSQVHGAAILSPDAQHLYLHHPPSPVRFLALLSSDLSDAALSMFLYLPKSLRKLIYTHDSRRCSEGATMNVKDFGNRLRMVREDGYLAELEELWIDAPEREHVFVTRMEARVNALVENQLGSLACLDRVKKLRLPAWMWYGGINVPEEIHQQSELFRGGSYPGAFLRDRMPWTALEEVHMTLDNLSLVEVEFDILKILSKKWDPQNTNLFRQLKQLVIHYHDDPHNDYDNDLYFSIPLHQTSPLPLIANIANIVNIPTPQVPNRLWRKIRLLPNRTRESRVGIENAVDLILVGRNLDAAESSLMLAAIQCDTIGVYSIGRGELS